MGDGFCYACVKGRSDGRGKPDGEGGVEPSRCRERNIFHSVLKNVSDSQVSPAERVLTIADSVSEPCVSACFSWAVW